MTPTKATTALVSAPPTTPIRRVVLANSLQEASPRSFLHVDRKGRVRSARRYKVLQAVSYGALGGTLVAAMGLYGSLLGLPGFGVGAVLAAWVGYRVGQGRMLQHAANLLVQDHFDEAEAILQRLLTGWGTPMGVRALARQNLGALCTRQGRFAEALVHQEEALRLHGKWPRHLSARTVGYAYVVTLVNLGRRTDARTHLDALGAEPEGEYLRMWFFTAWMYLGMAEGRLDASDARLHEIARFSLGITGAAALLGLCAWAWDRRGDADQFALCLSEAFDRLDGLHLPESMPMLWAWMGEHAARAGVQRAPSAEGEPA